VAALFTSQRRHIKGEVEMTSLRRKTATIAFVKKVCKELKQPFTEAQLTERMHGRRYNYPTTRELQHILTKMDFIEVVGKETTHTGTTTQYMYVGD
jgi:hypothetical protein